MTGENGVLRCLDQRFTPVELLPQDTSAFADVNIEVAHVPASLLGDECTLAEITACMRRFEHIVGSLEYGVGAMSLTTICLVDDYNHPGPADFAGALTRHVDAVESSGATLDYIVFEADLELLKDEFLCLNGDDGIVRYMRQHRRSPCSAHIAMWYLARLGKLATPLPALQRVDRSRVKPFFANQLLSILPRYYDTFEERAAIILGRSVFPHIVGQINHAYFEADPPANLEYLADTEHSSARS